MISEREKILDDVAKRAALEVGVALYDVEEKQTNHGLVALIYITKIGGVSVEDCIAVNRLAGSELELLDAYKDRNTLEVSSPGLERELRYKKHYASAINEKVKVKFQAEEERVVVQGILAEVTPQAIKIIKETEEEVIIPFTSIKKARTVFDFSDEKER
jgi:ribosome maturation factor RimP